MITKRLTALLPNCAVNLFDKRDGKLTLAVSAPSMFRIPHQRYLSRRFPMGGGHVSRPDFGMPQPDPAYPLTEFYLLLQHALDKAGRFALPALYARVQAPARHIYLDEAREYLSLSPTGREGISACWPRAVCSCCTVPCTSSRTARLQPCCSPRSAPAPRWRCSCCRPLCGRTRCRRCRTPCGADAAADHAGCDAGRYRPGSAGQKAGWHSDEQALAAPSEGRDLPCRTGGPAAESI